MGLEMEIVEFNPQMEMISILRKWWRANSAFSTIDEDNIFEDMLENSFEELVIFMNALYKIGINPKQAIVDLIINKQINNVIAIPSESQKQKRSFENDNEIQKFIKEIESELKNNSVNQGSRNRVNMTIIIGKQFK